MRPEQLSRFLPPAGGRSGVGGARAVRRRARRVATCCSSSAPRRCRATPGQPAFPGGAVDDTDADVRRGRAARGRGGDRARPVRRRRVRHAAGAVAAAERLRRHAGARLVARAVARRRRRPRRGRERRRACRCPSSSTRPTACSVRHPSGFVGPAFDVRGLLVWGFTAGLLSRLFALVGWERPWDPTVERELRSSGERPRRRPARRRRARGVRRVAAGAHQRRAVVRGLHRRCARGRGRGAATASATSTACSRSRSASSSCIVGAGIGNAVASLLGAWIRSYVTWRPARVVDSAGGSMFGILSSRSWPGWWPRRPSSSRSGRCRPRCAARRVLGEIDRVLPETARDWVSGLRDGARLDRPPARPSPASPSTPSSRSTSPIPRCVKDPAVRRACGSLVKVEGIARGVRRR